MKNTTTFDSTSDDYLIITSPFKKEKWINFLSWVLTILVIVIFGIFQA